MFTLLSLLAQNPPTTQAPPSFLQSPFVPMILAIVVMFFFMSRAKKKQEQQRQETLEKLKPGQKVQTIGGIVGVVHSTTDREVTIKVDETNNVKIKFIRGAIAQVFSDDKPETKQ